MENMVDIGVVLTYSDNVGMVLYALGGIRRILDTDFTSGEQILNFEERVYKDGFHCRVRRLMKHPDTEIRNAVSYFTNFLMTF